MQSVVEVVCAGNNGSIGSVSGGKIYNTIYTDPGYCKMVIVQDDEKFPSPRLCLLRKWPNFEGGFGFHLYEDLLNSTGALKIENVIRGSPAEAGGLRANDVIIEINGDNIEYKSFFRLIEILKDAFSQHEMELLVLAELDAEWYRARNISVNGNFPNIEYCETPYYGHKFKPLDLPTTQCPQQPQQQQTGSSHIRINNPQIEFHSNTGKLFRTTLVIDKNKDTVYRRIEELPNSNEQQQQQQQQQDDVQPLRVYYRKGYGGLQEEALHTMIDSGHGSLSARRSTPISTTTVGSPYSTIGKSCGEQVAVDLLHDKWAELMDKYLDNRFRSSEDFQQDQQQQQQQQQQHGSISKKSHVIMLNNENYDSTKRSRSAHATSDYNSSGGSFSFLFSGRDDYQKRSQSPQPYHYHRQSIPQTRYNMSSPTRSTTPNRSSKDRANSNERTEQHRRESSSSPYRSAAPHSIILRPKVLSQSLGFQLDENELIRNNSYYVKYVEGGSASSMAGLKDGDKITKINGKSTSGMSYDEFCNEILIAQQQQQQNKHNMIHLMVMRKSNKSTSQQQQGSSINATTANTTMNTSTITTHKPTVSFNTSLNNYNNNNNMNIPINSTSSNLVSVVKVTSPTTPNSSLFVDDKPVRGGILPASNRPNVIYTHEHIKEESSHSYSSTVQYGHHTTTQQIPTTDKYSIPSATLSTKPEQTIPSAVLATQPQNQVPSATLATQPPTSAKNPLSILTKLSLQADREKADATKPEIIPQKQQETPSIIQIDSTVPNATFPVQPPKTKEIPSSLIAQIEPSVPTETLATQPPTSVKNPLSILTKFSILADREKTDGKKPEPISSITTINIEKEPAKEIKIEREQPTNIPITKPVVVEENIVMSQTIISTIQETNHVNQQEIITPPKVDREPTDFTDHEPIKPIEGTTINSQIDDDNLTESVPSSKPIPSQPQEEPVKIEKPVSIPSLVVSSLNDKPSEDANSIKSKLNSYHIDRNPEYFGFGIILHTDKEKEQDGETLSYPCLEIEKNSPADVAGLKNGQRLIAVNNEFINREFKSINSLAQAIDDCYYQRGSTDFLVLDEEVWESIKTEQTIIHSLTTITTSELHKVQTNEKIVSLKPKDETSSKDSTKIQNDKIVPRFCRLQRETREDQYGFDFKTLKSEGKHIATNVRDGYPAQKAGLRNGDYILEVNGRSIEGIEHEAVVNLIFSNIKQVDLLVVEDLKGYKKVRKQQETIMQQVATSSSTKFESINRDVNRHRIHLLPTYKGIGLHLNYDGVINYIEPSSPAELAGLCKDQKIVEINDINVRGKTNREIASIIRENMNDLIIGVENITQQQPSKENVIDAFVDEPQQSIKPKDSVIKTLIESNVINPQPTSQRSPAQPQKIRPVDENIFMQSKAVSDIGLNLPAASSPNLSVSKGKSSSNNKLSSNGGLKKNFKNKFGSCLGLNTVSNKSNINDLIDDPNSIRVCNLVSRSDFLGYGFSLRKNEVGPHQIANVELNSPSLLAGLQDDDYLLKINDINVVGERYSKTVTRIKNESEKGILKLEVVEPTKISKDLRETRIDTQSGYASVSSVGKLSPIMSSSTKPIKKQRKGSKEIDPEMFSGSVRSVPEYMSVTPNTSKRPSSASPGNTFDGLSSQQQNRPFSMNDLDNIDPKSTVKSYDSATTGFSAGALNLSGNITSGSVRSVPNLPFTAKNTPKFKRCTVIAISNFKGFGFTINSQVKPKYMIHDVDKNSPAEFAGLRQNDVIIEINNKNIRKTSFEKVRMMLSDAYIVGKVEVLVISKEGYTWFKQKKKRFSNSSKLTKENNVEVFSNEFQTATTTATEQINSGSRISITNLNQTITSPFSTVNDNVLSSLEQQENREIFTTILRRRGDYQGFGISLATNKNAAKEEKLNFPVITNVESSSPGESADLRKNDFILEINNQSTYKQSSESIANLIRNSGNEVKMVVSRERAPKPTSDVNIDEQQSLELAQSAIAAASIVAITSQKNQPLQKDSEGEKTPEIIVRRVSRASMNDNKSKRSRSESPNIISSAVTLSSSKIYTDSPSVIRARNLSEPPSPSTLPSDAPVPRLCRIRTYEPNLGFVVAGSKTKSGIFKICDIKENSPAFNSGLRNEDYIIEVSGNAVEKLKYEEIVNLIKTKQAEDDLQLLVADRKTLEWYKSRNTEISSRFVPKLTYIETLLQEELQFNLTEQLTNTTSRLSQESLTALEKIATNSKFVKKVTSSEHGETSYIIRKVYL